MVIWRFKLKRNAANDIGRYWRKSREISHQNREVLVHAREMYRDCVYIVIHCAERVKNARRVSRKSYSRLCAPGPRRGWTRQPARNSLGHHERGERFSNLLSWYDDVRMRDVSTIFAFGLSHTESSSVTRPSHSEYGIEPLVQCDISFISSQ